MELTLFSYRPGDGYIYKVPALAKLVLALTLTPLLFSFEISGCMVVAVLAAVTQLASGFSAREILKDLKVMFYYACLLYTTALISNMSHLETYSSNETLSQMFIPPKDTVLLFTRMLATILVTSLMFKTTSPVQLKAAVSSVELGIRKMLGRVPVLGQHIGQEATLSNSIAMVLTFIPRVLMAWQKLDMAWRNRGGRNRLAKIIVLLPAFFSVCMEDAERTLLAVSNRNPS